MHFCKSCRWSWQWGTYCVVLLCTCIVPYPVPYPSYCIVSYRSISYDILLLPEDGVHLYNFPRLGAAPQLSMIHKNIVGLNNWLYFIMRNKPRYKRTVWIDERVRHTDQRRTVDLFLGGLIVQDCDLTNHILLSRRQGVFASKNGPDISHLFMIVAHLGHILSEGGHSGTRQ